MDEGHNEKKQGNGATIFSEMKNNLKNSNNDGDVLRNVVVLNACIQIRQCFLLKRCRLMNRIKYHFDFFQKRHRSCRGIYKNVTACILRRSPNHRHRTVVVECCFSSSVHA